MSRAAAWNLRLAARLDAFGPIGEGIALQSASGARTLLWLAHGAQVAAVDVTEPSAPRIIASIEARARSLVEAPARSLDVFGDRLAIGTEAGVAVYDIATPDSPRRVTTLSAPAHHVRFADPQTLHVCGPLDTPQPHDARDGSVFQIIDLARTPSRIGAWWLPGTMRGDAAPPPRRIDARFDTGLRAHASAAGPSPEAVYLAYGDAGVALLDVTVPAQPRLGLRWSSSPPYHGGTHRFAPLGATGYAVALDATFVDSGVDAPKNIWMLDLRAGTKALSIGVLPSPPMEAFAKRGGRCGPNGLALDAATRTVYATFGAAGLRVYDCADPYSPAEIAYYVPESLGAPSQLHDVVADARGCVYAVERLAGGLLVLEAQW